MTFFDQLDTWRGARIVIHEGTGNEYVGFYVRHDGDRMYLSHNKRGAEEGRSDFEYLNQSSVTSVHVEPKPSRQIGTWD